LSFYFPRTDPSRVTGDFRRMMIRVKHGRVAKDWTVDCRHFIARQTQIEDELKDEQS